MSDEPQRPEGGRPQPGQESTQAWSPPERAARPPYGGAPQPGYPQQPSPWGPPPGSAGTGPGGPVPYGPVPGGAGPYGPVPGTPAPRRKRGCLGVAIAAVVFLLLAAGGGYAAYYRGSHEDGMSASAKSGGPLKGQVLWQSKDAPQSPIGHTFVGGWHTADLTVTIAPQGLVAYDSHNGQRRWQLPAPPVPAGGQSLICGTSLTIAGNVGVIGFGAGNGGTVRECNAFGLVDLARGQLRGQGTLQSGNSIGSSDITADVIGDTALIDYGGSVTGFDLSGHQRWRLDPKTAVGPDCFVNDMLAAPDAELVVFDCLNRKDAVTVGQLSPATGTLAKKAPVALPPGLEAASAKLLTAKPVVLSDTSSQSGAIISLDDAYRVRATIQQKGAWGSLDLQPYFSLNGHPTVHAAVSADTIVLATEKQTVTDLRDTNNLLAFDLATGRQRWTTSLGPKVTEVPVTFAGGAFLAMSTGTYENPPQIFRLAPADGKATSMGPAYSRDLIQRPAVSRLWWDGSRMFGLSMVAMPDSPTVYALG